jgi:hypothetical protein
MKSIVRQVRELIETAEPGMRVISCSRDEPFNCPTGETLWQEYRQRNPDGLKVPPVDRRCVTDPELIDYIRHGDSCHACNER